MVPCMRLFGETVFVDCDDGLRRDYREVEAPAIQLSFAYRGTIVYSGDPCHLVYATGKRAMAPIQRDRDAEARARYVLESFGAIEIDCLSDCAVSPDSVADYLIQLDGDTHAACGFQTYVVPQLESMGWRIEVDDSYPYRVLATEPPWYACVQDDERPDWFGLELGVEVEGKRINLLPALLDLIDRSAELEEIERILRIPGRLLALPVGDGEYISIAPERAQALVRVLLELYRGEGAGSVLAFPETAIATLGHLEHAVGGDVEWNGNVEAVVRGRGLSAPPASEQCPPPGQLRAELRPYQHEGFCWLQRLRAHGSGGILADDMGLGKTLQTIAHLLAEHSSECHVGPGQDGEGRLHREGHGRGRPSLIIAPTSLLGNWLREIERFAPSLSVLPLQGKGRHRLWDKVSECDILLTSYPLLLRDYERLAALEYRLLVLDEAQALKNSRSQVHRMVSELSAEQTLCLSGTPVENHLQELWALCAVAVPGLLGSSEQFRAWFRGPIEKRGDRARMEALRQRVSPYILRRCKRDVMPELPPKTEVVRPIELDGAQRDLYESIRVAAHTHVRHAIARKGFSRSTITILDALMKLRQVCCDPRLVKVNAASRVKESAKCTQFFELLQTQLSEGRRVLVFSQFARMLTLLSQGLNERGIAHSLLTGSTPNRQRVIDTFCNGCADVFLISLKAGGTGLNLTRADTVIHYDPWWNPAAQAQATDRAYRIGQEHPVFVYNLIVAGSVEERMLVLQQRKRHLADALLGQGAASPDWNEGDIEMLFAPLEG